MFLQIVRGLALGGVQIEFYPLLPYNLSVLGTIPPSHRISRPASNGVDVVRKKPTSI